MMVSLLLGAPLALATGAGLAAWARRSPRRALRGLVAVNAVVALGALAITVLAALGVAEPAQAAAGAAANSGDAFIAAGIAIAGSTIGAAIAVAGAALLFTGFLTTAGLSGAGVTEALVELLDAVLRIASNVFSFVRLAAFGLMHAALGAIVLDGTTSLWGQGAGGKVAAVVVFAVGTSAAFALEALVAMIQAMRLEYYELFSRVYAGEGERFRPWRIPVVGEVQHT